MALPIPDHLRLFIFECLDSVEALEVLLLLFRDPDRVWTAERLAVELRLNVNSVAERVRRLADAGLLMREPDGYRFRPASERRIELMRELDEFYHTHRHRVLEAIFSPMRKAHHFALAFRVRAHRPKGDDHDS